MNLLKKGVSLLLLLILAVGLVGCGSKEESKTFTSEQNGMKMELTYTYKGDKVTKQTTKNVIPYKTLGVSTKEDAEKSLKALSDKYQGVKGLKESLTYNDDNVVESVEVDYENADLDKLAKIPGMLISGNTKKGISMKKSQEVLEKQGFTEKK
ncbi:DUF1307 domain-containing protein [Listeria booriae]|uniref:Uncharacterized protein n=1 Tax=Listeria booriae TaxID=1552123 RepID=A0A099W314_9LIST|nr:DUF1307 domain-containing protein [Listeria booriae]KGL40244.1 hypothetical protein EP57_10080 [Listeria booriae]MBC1891723.1 DUF1307 domain-containing protein [Listeria booriae]MBC1896764.1 DUF1307 domain-containing protein [Listeria booriae]MBC1911538.1 DUF1307 domain-containing protein [Listeria booriae]MBC2020398.1 DUF1307 domain-containing protein [Listeria booriae]